MVNTTPRPLYPKERYPVPIIQEAAWAPGPVWIGVENLAPPGFDPRTVQPVGSRYTDYATRPVNVHIKTLKNAPTCFDLIQIIFRELICSLLKLLILEFVKNAKVNVVKQQHNIWSVYVLSV